MKISILCPTRGRPAGMERLVKSAVENARDRSELEFIFYIDEDDPDSALMAGMLYGEYRVPVYPVFGPRIILSKMWNRCYDLARGEILMHGADDIEFKTKDWDEIVRNAFRRFDDRIVFVYGADGIQPNTFGTHGFLHRNWVETVGYFVPPLFSSDYNDTWLNDVSWLIGRKCFVPIVTEHHHYTCGKAEIDQNTKDRLERHQRDNPKAIYDSSGEQREKDAQKLKDFINSYNEAANTLYPQG